MITIGNNSLTAELIDPYRDRDKLGSRYCAGGYVWQVYDKDGRALLSGPHFPSKTPPVFDGQGMPEVFETPLGGDEGGVGDDVCVIGVGIVEKTSDIAPFHPRNNPHVRQFCDWDIERGDDFVVMAAEQRFGDKSMRLRREVRVNGNCVESVSAVTNTGGIDVGIRWFSHPFFPVNTDGLACGKIDRPIKLPDSAGYEIGADGMISMKPDYPWEKGLFQLLDVPPERLNFTIPHPVVKQIDLKADYDVIRCALWANSNTFSFEPFMQRVVRPSESVSWRVAFVFSDA